ncbi:MAG: hypothetical protein ACJATT_000611 [Myxococcota bacterium]|jgi:hypothetical protein
MSRMLRLTLLSLLTTFGCLTNAAAQEPDAGLATVELTTLPNSSDGPVLVFTGETLAFNLNGPVQVVSLVPGVITARQTPNGFSVTGDLVQVGSGTVLVMLPSGMQSYVFNVDRAPKALRAAVPRGGLQDQPGLGYRFGFTADLTDELLNSTQQMHSANLQYSNEDNHYTGRFDAIKNSGTPWRIPNLRVEGLHDDAGIGWAFGQGNVVVTPEIQGQSGIAFNGASVSFQPKDTPGALTGWVGAARPSSCCDLATPQRGVVAGASGRWQFSKSLSTVATVGATANPLLRETTGFGSARMVLSDRFVRTSVAIARAGGGSGVGVSSRVQNDSGSSSIDVSAFATDRDYRFAGGVRIPSAFGINYIAQTGVEHFRASIFGNSTRFGESDSLPGTKQDTLGTQVNLRVASPLSLAASYRWLQSGSRVPGSVQKQSHVGSLSLSTGQRYLRVTATALYSVSTIANGTAPRGTPGGNVLLRYQPPGVWAFAMRYNTRVVQDTSNMRHTIRSQLIFTQPVISASLFTQSTASTEDGRLEPSLGVGAGARWLPNLPVSLDAQAFHGLALAGMPSRTRLTLGVSLQAFNGTLGSDGRVIGDVFADLNGNGTRDEDEPEVPNASVDIGGAQASTPDDSGRFKAKDVPNGTYNVMVSADGYTSNGRETVQVGGVGVARVSVPLTYAGTVDIRAFADSNGDGVFQNTDPMLEISRVTLVNRDTEREVVVELVSGRGIGRNLPPGRYTAKVSPLDFPANYLADSVDIDFQLVPGRLAKAHFALAPIRTVGGDMWIDTDGDGRGGGQDDELATNRVIRLGSLETTTDSNGRFVFRDVPPGEYVLRSDVTTVPISINLTANPTQKLDYRLVIVTNNGQPFANVEGYLPYIDRETREPVFDEPSGLYVVVNPDTGLPSLINRDTGNFELWTPRPEVIIAQTYIDPETNAPVIDSVTDRPVVVNPATGLPALQDPDTGLFTSWAPPSSATDAGEPAVADAGLVPYLDPATLQPVIDLNTDRPVFVDPQTGLPALRDPDTGAFAAWSPPSSAVDAGEFTVPGAQAPAFVDAQTARPVLDPPTGRPVVLNPSSGLPSLRDPVTGAYEPWRPPAGMEVTLPPYLDPQTGQAVVDPSTGQTVVIDPVTAEPAIRDVETGIFEPFEPAVAVVELEALIDPETGDVVTDPETGQAVVLNPVSGLPSVRDVNTGELVGWSPPDLPDYAPLLNDDGSAVVDLEGNAILLDDQGRTVVINPDTNEARVIVLDTGPARLARIQVTPENIILAPLEVVQLNASGAYTDRAVRDLTAAASWTSSRPAVATIDSTGRLRANQAGFTEVTAEVDGVANEPVRVEVVDVPVVGLTLQPAEISIQPDGSFQLSAQAIYTDGRIADVSDAIRWFGDDRSIATVDRSGVVRGVKPGQTTVAGEFQGVRTQAATVIVGDLGVQTLVVQGIDSAYSSGEIIAPTILAVLPSGDVRDVSEQITWVISDGLVAKTNREGDLRARIEGSTDITATWGSASSETYTIRVSDASPIGMTLFPPVSAMVVDATESLSATAVYGDGSAREITSYAEWVSSNPSVIEALPNGQIRAVGMGVADITARRGDVRTEPLRIEVLNPDTAGITLEPRSVALEVGADAMLQAFAVADSGRIDVTDTAEWQSSDSSVLTVDSSGRVTGVSPGSARVFARWGSMITPNATVNITLPDVLMVTGDPLIERLPLGAEVDLGASAVLMDGSFVDVKNSIEWTSTDPRVVSIRGSSLVAQGAGTATITGELDGSQTQPMVVNVTDVQVNSLTIASSSALSVGTVQPFFASAQLADNSELDLTWSIDWTTSNPGVLAVQAGSNLIRATGAGTATLTATFGSVTTSIEVTVGR